MSKTWYPIIDEEKCIECGACVDMCPNGVYDKDRAPMPMVIAPDNCGQGCKGCGSLCPVEAVTYFGDTGQEGGGCGCGGGCGDDCDCGGGCDCG